MKKDNILKSKYLEFVVSTILIILLLIFILSSTYARYRSTKEFELNSNVARWNIKLNGNSLSDTAADFSTIVTPVFPGNTNIAANVIAPKAEGYFDLVIDYSEVDVSFTYSFNINSTESKVVDLMVYKYELYGCDITDPANSTVGPGTTVNVNANSLSKTFSISNNITYNEAIPAEARKKSIRVYVKWIDDGVATMDNAADTNSTKITDTSLTHAENSLKVTASFVQV